MYSDTIQILMLRAQMDFLTKQQRSAVQFVGIAVAAMVLLLIPPQRLSTASQSATSSRPSIVMRVAVSRAMSLS